MFGKIKEVFGKITGASVIDEKAVKEIIKELQRVLISSDVNIKLVQEISNKIKKEALSQELPPGISRKEHLTKTVYDALVEILGEQQYVPRIEPHKILLVGLYGSGKTTTAGKLAKFYSKRGLKPAMITTDTWRPAAYEQLKQIGSQINVPAYGNPEEKDALKILKQGLEKAKNANLIIVDSAGRDSLNEELIDEIRRIKQELKPDEVFLVISSDIGQTAVKQATEFNEAVGLTGVIATKADASGKAGGALSACHVAKVPVAFIGTGEKVDDFEVFNAEKFIGRLLGVPDIGSLVEKMKEAVEETDFNPEDLMSGDYDLNAFYKQLEATKKMGSMKKILEMMGLGGAATVGLAEQSEEKMKKFKVIMDSMTKYEKENPNEIKSSRVKRIARGSGTTEKEVKELLKQFEAGKKMIKKFKKGKLRNMNQLMKKFQAGGFKL